MSHRTPPPTRTRRHDSGVGLLARRGAELAAALVVAGVVATLALLAVNSLPLPEPSWLSETVAATVGAVVVVIAGWLLLRRATGDRTLWLLGTAGPAVLASTHLGLLLHGTPHYLFGLGGDQINRVSYLTRFAGSPALADPFYADAAPFYPAQWFWVGGRLAALFGVDGWEFYKPYAIVTMAVAGALATVAWRWLVPLRLAVLFGLVTGVVGVHTNAYEPYSWILICLLPQVVMAAALMCTRRQAWPLVLTTGVYLGWAALGYTLVAGVAALLVTLVVAAYAVRDRADRARVLSLAARLVAAAALSAAIALLFWHGYLSAVLGGTPTESSVATDFTPESGSRWPLPMFEMTASGLLCLIGTAWVVLTVWPRGAGVPGVGSIHDDDEVALPSRARALLLARCLALMVVTVLAWFTLSGLRALTGGTLLPFRMIPVITLALALAGVIGALTMTLWARSLVPSDRRGRITAVAVVFAGLAAVQMVQYVTDEDVEFAAAARQMPAPPGDLLGAIDEMTGQRPPESLVLLTSDPSLTAYRPYFAFQAPAHAYATPTGRYSERTAEIRDWAASGTPTELVAEMESGPFRPPDVLVLERETPAHLVFPALVNVMPLEHNNEREAIVFRPDQFADPALFDVREVGSRTVIVRR